MEGKIVQKPVQFRLTAEMYLDGSWSFIVSGLHNKFQIIGFLDTIGSMVRDEAKKELAGKHMQEGVKIS